ncbi:MAG: HEAT repeat domain-containing protein [Myxococcota bacterium]
MTYTDLEHIDHRVRLHAIGRAGRDLSPSDPERLLALMRPRFADPHAQVRWAAALALGDAAAYHPQLVLTALADWAQTAAGGDDRDNRRAHIAVLAALGRAGRRLAGVPRRELGEGWSRACSAALEACGAPGADTRFQAVAALVRLEASDARAHTEALARLDDDDPEVVAAAAEWLIGFGDATVLPSLERAHQRLEGSKAGPQILLALAELLAVASRSGEGEPWMELKARVRRSLVAEAGSLPHGLRACEALVVLGDDSVIAPLERVQRGWFTHRLIRVATAAVLASLGHAQGLEALRRALSHRKVDARGYAIEWAGRLGTPVLLPELLTILNRTRDYHSDTAAYALGLLGPPHATDGLLSALDDPRAEVRVEAARALDRHGLAAERLAALATDDPSADVRAAAAGLDDPLRSRVAEGDHPDNP